jgi:TolA-binding protein
MRAGKIAGLLAATLVLASAANAQVPKGLERSGAGAEASAATQRLDVTTGNRFQTGVEALQAKNYLVAEGIFRDVLRQDRNHADANFLMGVTQMGLEKWDEAKKYLEIAVRKSPKKPDPKSRLGVTLIKLGDIEGAKKQREELVKLQTACKGNCRDGQFISDGIAMIDGALPKS